MPDKTALDRVRALVKKEADENNWKYHILLVVKYSKKLASILNANEETVELAALLYDIGRIKFGNEDHHITGIPEAERILKEQGYPEEVINEVKHCIESHRGSTGIKPRTLVAQIVANADAMAHFDIIPFLFYSRAAKQPFKEAFEGLYAKIERDWNKMTLPEARRMSEDKYNAIKLVLDSNKQYL